ncbi:SDR family oxidoreductase [Bordetella sp. 2513F-2]
MSHTREITVVITGASSGIGRATAERYAAEGARLVLAARGIDKLESAAQMCRRFGAQVCAVPTDVTDPAEVAALAARAAEFGNGRIDIWINNAGVGAVGPFDETPVAAHRQVVQVNLLGYLYGAHAVLPYFKRQGRGVLVNVLSLGAWAPTPYAVAYTASKYGLRGYSEALRGELHDWPDIHICDVFPSVVDTPGFAHGANYTGRQLRPPGPLYDARQVARAIHDAVARRRRAVTVGAVAGLARVANGVAPPLLRVALALAFEAYFRRAEPAPITDGTLHAPVSGEPGRIDGGWRAGRGPLREVGLLAGAGFLGMLMWQKLRR